MLLELAIADAYGIAFEFVKDPAEHGLVNDLATFQQNPKYDTLLPASYTDDTQRTFATAHWLHMATAPYFEFSPVDLIEYLQMEFGLFPRAGYSKNFQSLMEERLPPHQFLRRITVKKASNGSVMGVLPCGFLPHPPDVRLAAGIQALATHSHETIPYAEALALAVHYFRFDLGERSDLFDFLESEGVSLNFPETFEGTTLMSAENTTHSVFDLLMGHDSLSGILRTAVERGGDTDSAAALAVGLGSLSREIENDLPKKLVDGVEQGCSEFKERAARVETILFEMGED